MGIAEKSSVGYIKTVSEKAVIFESDVYVPFEPKKVHSELYEIVQKLRTDIRQSVSQLIPQKGELILASYSENDKIRMYDVENMLFYNIGSSAFRQNCKHQVAFCGDIESFSAYELERSDVEERYFYSYEVVPESSVLDLLKDKKVSAHWNQVPIDMNYKQSPARYYAALRAGTKNIVFDNVIRDNAPIGLRIELTLPRASSAVAVMKPLVDGVICAFHGEKDATIDVLCKLFEKDFVKQNTRRPEWNLLGDREYVARYRGMNSFKWNPEDERLCFALITVHQGTHAEFSGELYEWV